MLHYRSHATCAMLPTVLPVNSIRPIVLSALQDTLWCKTKMKMEYLVFVPMGKVATIVRIQVSAPIAQSATL